MMESFDVNDPTEIAAKRWGSAIRDWQEGYAQPLAELVEDLPEIPDFAREFLRDLVNGDPSIKGRGGRPTERPPWMERRICIEVFRGMDNTNKAAAIEAVANRRGDITDGQIRGIFDRLAKQGFTRDKWLAWGRPDLGKNPLDIEPGGVL